MQIKKLSLDKIAIKRINIYPGRPTILFLHDSLGCIELWRDFPYKLGELTKCNVVIYDRQGYGGSCLFSYTKRDNYYMELEADILDELMVYWKIDKAILFGHSDGGSIALISAAKYPTRILGIIAEGAHVFVEHVTLNGIKDAIHLYERTNLKNKLEKYHGDKTDEMFWAWAATWTTDAFASWNIEKYLPLIQCPSLIIQGKDDEYGTLKQVESITNQVSGKTEGYIVPNVGHTPHRENQVNILEKSTLFIDGLIEYLNSSINSSFMNSVV